MKNLGVYISIGIFFIGVIAGWGRLQAETSTTKEKVNKIEVKVETLTNDVSKLGEKQLSVKEQVQGVDKKLDKLTDLIIDIAKTQREAK